MKKISSDLLNPDNDNIASELNDTAPIFIKEIIKLSEQIRELKESANNKDRFLQVIAHDLRKPFNVLLGVSKLLIKNLHTYDKVKIEEMLYLNHKTIVNTHLFLEDMLTWTSTQTGVLQFNPGKIWMYNMLNQSIEFYRCSANAKNIGLNLSCDQSTTAVADDFMVKTIVRNLILNAIKFTNNGGKISISAIKSEKEIQVSVADNGIGIDNRFLSEIWDPTSTFSTSGTANEQGTGLGLIICKEFVEKHGGRIWVKSKLGKGSTFYFTLPF